MVMLARTEDGILLRKRAEEIVALLEKTEAELRSGTSVQGEVSIGGMPTKQILSAAAEVRKAHPEVQFRFYASDATDVTEKLDHGSLDFAVLLTPVDEVKYESVVLGEFYRWGVMLPAKHISAKKSAVTREDLRSMTLVMHHRVGLQHEIAVWAETEPESLNIAATYNVVNGDPSEFVRSGLGCLLTTENHITSLHDPDICFLPLDPPLLVNHALVWKRHCVMGKAAGVFLDEIRRAEP